MEDATRIPMNIRRRLENLMQHAFEAAQAALAAREAAKAAEPTKASPAAPVVEVPPPIEALPAEIPQASPAAPVANPNPNTEVVSTNMENQNPAPVAPEITGPLARVKSRKDLAALKEGEQVIVDKDFLAARRSQRIWDIGLTALGGAVVAAGAGYGGYRLGVNHGMASADGVADNVVEMEKQRATR
jgi:hypothetical protein